MDADTWNQTDDWPAMLRALPNIDGTRKLRLWCVAWARLVLAVGERDAAHFKSHSGFFMPTRRAEYKREIEAGEAFADGQLTRRELQAVRPTPGGPHNVFRFTTGLSRLTTDRLIPVLGIFARTFQTPTAPQLTGLLREIFQHPARALAFDPACRTDTTVSLARLMYESREFSAMPILADALQDAGCDNSDILDHCRDTQLTHVRGCWVVDLVLGKA
jgi:hypothetical protein